MRIYIDNEPFATDRTVLSEIVAAAQQEVEAAGRLIVEVRVDGQTASGEDLDRLANEPLAAEQLQLMTAEPADLAVQTLKDVQEALEQARDRQQHAMQLLSTDDTAAALEHVREALEIWQQAQLAVHQIGQLLNLPLDDIEVDGRPLPQIIDELAEKLSAARDQLSSSDWIGLGDTLGYEMDEAAEQWSNMLEVLIERVKQAN